MNFLSDPGVLLIGVCIAMVARGVYQICKIRKTYRQKKKEGKLR